MEHGQTRFKARFLRDDRAVTQIRVAFETKDAHLRIRVPPVPEGMPLQFRK
jgi:hypothetical protein